jgi:hypothetical protein
MMRVPRRSRCPALEDDADADASDREICAIGDVGRGEMKKSSTEGAANSALDAPPAATIIGDADRDRAVTMVEEEIRMRPAAGDLSDGSKQAKTRTRSAQSCAKAGSPL